MSRDILITPNRGFTGSNQYPEISFNGLSASSIKLKVDDDGSVVYTGTYGVLFNINDKKDGLLHSVNDVSGLPILSVYSYDYVQMGKWNKNTLVVNSDKVGVGLTGPTTPFHIYATQSGAFRLQDGSQGLNKILVSDANGVGTWTTAASSGLTGIGVNNYIPKWTGVSSLSGTSSIYDDGTNVIVGGTSSNYKFSVITTVAGDGIFLMNNTSQYLAALQRDPNSGTPRGYLALYDSSGNSQVVFNALTYAQSDFINTGRNLGIGSAFSLAVGATSKLHIQGIDSTSSNYGLKVDNSSSSPLFYVRNDGNTNINGRVGIGAISSDEALLITNTNGDNSRIKVVNQLSGGSFITFDNAGTSTLGFIAGVDGTGLGIIGHQGNFDVNFRTNNTSRLIIKANGDISSLPLYSNTSNSGTASFLGIDDTGKLYNTGITASGSSSWAVTGNTGLSASTDFIGTTDNTDLVFRTNNVEVGRFKSNGQLNIGTSSISSRVTISATGSGEVALYLNTASTQDSKLFFGTNNSASARLRIYVEDSTQTSNLYTVNSDTIFWNGNGLAQSKTLTLYTDTSAKFEKSVLVGSVVNIDGIDATNFPININSSNVTLTRLKVNNGGNIQTDIQLSNNNGANALYIGVNNTTSAFIDNRSGGNLLFQNGGTTVMTFDTSGNLGIGVTPTYKLDVSSSAATAFRVSTVATFNSAVIQSDQYSSSLSINSAVAGPIGGYNSALLLNSNGVFRGSFNAESTTSVTTLESAGGYWLLLKNSTTESIGLGQGGNYIQFNTNGTNKMFIDGITGNLSVGGASASFARTHIKGIDSSLNYALFLDNSSNNPLLTVRNDGNIYALPTYGTSSNSGTYSFLGIDSTGKLFNTGVTSSGGGGISGTGFLNYIPRWTSSTLLSGTSSIYDDGTHVSLGVTGSTNSRLTIFTEDNLVTSYGIRMVQAVSGNDLFYVKSNGYSEFSTLSRLSVGTSPDPATRLSIQGIGGPSTNNILIAYPQGGALIGLIVKENTNVGVGKQDQTPTARLHVEGLTSDSSAYALKVDNNTTNPLLYVRNDGGIYALPTYATQSNSGTFNLLGIDSTGKLFNTGLTSSGGGSSSGSGVTGSGIINYIPRWSSTDTLTSTSSIYDDGVYVGIGTTSSTSRLSVKGDTSGAGSYAFTVENLSSNNLLSLANDGLSILGFTGGNARTQVNIGNSQYFRINANDNAGFALSDSGSDWFRILPTAFDEAVLSSNGVLDIKAGGANTLYARFSEGAGGIGINIQNPTARVHIVGVDATSSNYALKVDSSTTNIISVRNDGKVGIGIATPLLSLSIKPTGNLDGFILQEDASNFYAAFQKDGTRGLLALYDGATSKVLLNSPTYGTLDYIHTGMNLAIGLNAASAKVHIYGLDSTSSNYALKVDNSSFTSLLSVRNDGAIIALPTYNLSSFTGTSGVVGIDSTGKLYNTGFNPSASTTGTIGIGLDGGGAVISTGFKQNLIVPYNCVITGWSVLASVTGSCVIDVWKSTGSLPNASNSIAGTEKPTLSSQIMNTDNALTTWTASCTSGDIIGFNVDSISLIDNLTLILKINKI